MHAKPQQQTLSIRVSESLREFLELSRQIIADNRHQSVSISDIAKMLLESAKEDRLDFRLEVAQLQRSPTKSLAQIRRKWQQGRPPSRAEWIFLGLYIRVACEELSENPRLPSSESLIAVLEALMVVRSHRRDLGADLDRHYLASLAGPKGLVHIERYLDPDTVPEVIADLIRTLRESVAAGQALLAGQTLYIALRDEVVSDAAACKRGTILRNRVREQGR